jgi:hypothetical protein
MDREVIKVELGDRAELYWDAADWFAPSGLMMSSRNSEEQNHVILHLMLALQEAGC